MRVFGQFQHEVRRKTLLRTRVNKGVQRLLVLTPWRHMGGLCTRGVERPLLHAGLVGGPVQTANVR
jgi:hypothetical protein